MRVKLGARLRVIRKSAQKKNPQLRNLTTKRKCPKKSIHTIMRTMLIEKSRQGSMTLKRRQTMK